MLECYSGDAVYLLCEDSTKDRTKSACYTPGSTYHSKVFSTLTVYLLSMHQPNFEALSTYRMLKRSLMQMLAKIINPPPPIPCTTLPPSNILILIDKAAMRDPTKKMTFARSRMGFRPKISLNLPHVGVDAAAAKR